MLSIFPQGLGFTSGEHQSVRAGGSQGQLLQGLWDLTLNLVLKTEADQVEMGPF